MPKIAVFEFETVTVNVYGQLQERQRHSAQFFPEDLGEGVVLELVAVPRGRFLMGAPKTEEGWHPTQSPLHEVTIASFWMSKYPVTQAQWSAVVGMPKVNRPLVPQPSCFSGKNRPVEQISWLDAVEFCDRLSIRTTRKYRLPSEAEWEYACRASPSSPHETLEDLSEKIQSPFCFGETITTELANYSGVDWEFEGRICSKGSYGKGPTGSDRRETIEVGSLQIANRFGLYDMHGNVREWCQDCWHNTYAGAPSDGNAWISEGDCNQRLLRGGSWNSGPKACRSAARGKMEPDASLYDIGFRVVCDM
jgi:formylglycine-generating enzyme required for sulfatase activity